MRWKAIRVLGVCLCVTGVACVAFGGWVVAKAVRA